MTPSSPPPKPPRPSSPGRIAGIDFGLVRIGVALTDPDRTLASPFESYNCRGPKLDAEWFRRFSVEEDVSLFVVGLPLHLDGGESPKSGQARRFAAWLNEITGIPVEFHDERFSSVEAEHILLDANLTNRRRKRRRDMLAAQIILTAYLESLAQRDAD
ncbi:MAG: Holliday junction resolvase RuvX [Patescibacteria group bacterium]|nr:Holliday junction resolvase RuvX [Patescibacteria group bacterium]